jgi:uncharacterized protein (UPF0210 family)
MTSTEIALLLNSNSEKITRIGEIIGKKIEESKLIWAMLPAVTAKTE